MKSLIVGMFAAGALITGCAEPPEGAESTEPGTPPDESPAVPMPPRMSLLLTDAPGDFDEVWVNIASISIESAADGWITLVDSPQSFDLLTLQNNVTAALGEASLAPGAYGQLRMIVDSAHVVTDGTSEDLRIASGAQTGIKINLDATLEENTVYTMVLDFDAARSIHATGQGWFMTPVVDVKELTGEPATQPEGETEGEGEGEGEGTPIP